MDEKLLDIQDLSVWYKTYRGFAEVVDHINLYVGKGEKIGLVGESGCGKTTTMKMVMRTLDERGIKVGEGSKLLFGGEDILAMDAKALLDLRRRKISMISQSPMAALNPVFTIGQQMMDVLKYSGQFDKHDKKGMLDAARKAIDSVMIPDPDRILNSYPHQLSGGMRQRICIATSLLTPRQLLIADEPGVTGTVTLENVTIRGAVRNFSSAMVTDLSQRPEEPEQPPAIQPGDVYTPSETTGEYLTYSNQQIPIYAGVERNRFSQGDFMWDPDRPDRLIYTGDDYRTRFGIDVSAYQNRASANNTIDWEAAKADGVEFAMVRIGLRGYGSGSIMEDAFYAQNIDGAMAAGIETGVYFFAQAITVEEAIEEADFVISLLEGHEIDGPVAYDWEMHDSTYRVYGTTPEMATACAVAFCERIEEAGYDAMVYAGQYVSYIKYDQGALEPYLSWYPEYKSESSELLYPTLYYHMDYWQYSSKCSVAGIGGNVDVNLQFIRR